MAIVKPFCCVRPAKEHVATIAALPYDVYNREEARAVVEKNPHSFLAIDRPETQFAPDADMYAPCVYEKAAQMISDWKKEGLFEQEEVPCFYLYELTMDGRTQTGIVGCASVDEYVNGSIKKHENTRLEKEQDRIRHVDTCSAQTGPIFLAYRQNATLAELIAEAKSVDAFYDFTSEDGIRHRVFRIVDADKVAAFAKGLEELNSLYIADGHHRAASAVKVGLKRREAFPDYTGDEEFNGFLSVIFPGEELYIMDYNRVVKDLNGYTTEEFLQEVRSRFEVECKDAPVSPSKKGEFGMFLDGKWYCCNMRAEDVPNDPVEGLDVSVLQNHLLLPVLGIEDPKTDARIDFVGGIRGLKELERRCQVDCKVAFSMYPTSIEELFDVADAGLLMPPKSTWFEPKLRSGIFIHEIEGE